MMLLARSRSIRDPAARNALWRARGPYGSGRPPSHTKDDSLSLLVRATRRGRAGARSVLGRNTDDLHTGAAGDVHCMDHLLKLHCRVAFHEDDLLRPGIVDLLQTSSEP